MDPGRRSDGFLAVSAALLAADRRGGLVIGSAVAVRLGARMVLATAAHTLADVARRGHSGLRVVPRGRYRADPVRILGLGVAAGPVAADVAWIEIDREGAERAGLHGVSPDSLGGGGDGAVATELIAHGFPAAGIEARQVSGTRFVLEADSLVGQRVEPGRRAVGFRKEHDLALSLRSAATPYGFSGGGVWTGTGRMVALARSWNRSRGLLFCTRIEHWMALIRADFPDTLP